MHFCEKKRETKITNFQLLQWPQLDSDHNVSWYIMTRNIILYMFMYMQQLVKDTVHLLSLDHKIMIIPTKNVASYLIFSRTAWFSAVFTQQHKIQPFLVTFGYKNVLRFTDNMTVLQCVVYGRWYWYWSIQICLT